MTNKRYAIRRFYRSRSRYHYFDDIAREDEWQLEVYLHGLGLMKKHKLKTVIDVGCGSAYKLLTYLGEYQTLGIEMPQTYKWLIQTYPEHNWLLSDFTRGKDLSADLVICSDVVEHLVDPDELVDFLTAISFQYLIISTPARDVLYQQWKPGYWGPPPNPSHMREWSFAEFWKYLSPYFNIIDHKITNMAQGTQMVVCKPKSKPAD